MTVDLPGYMSFKHLHPSRLEEVESLQLIVCFIICYDSISWAKSNSDVNIPSPGANVDSHRKHNHSFWVKQKVNIMIDCRRIG